MIERERDDARGKGGNGNEWDDESMKGIYLVFRLCIGLEHTKTTEKCHLLISNHVNIGHFILRRPKLEDLKNRSNS